MSDALTVRNLHVAYGDSLAVRGASLTVGRGETVAVVGGSGSGKTTLAHAVIGLLPPEARVTGGRIAMAGLDVTRASAGELRALRGRGVGLVPQDPGVYLNPAMRVGAQVAEVLRIHRLARRREAAAAAVSLLERAGLPDAAVRARQYPHELSGGMRQRVLIAIALAGAPPLIIADEPTSALDVTVQRQILDHLGLITRETGTAVLLITHDLAVAAERADRVAVMADGRVVEEGSADRVLTAPRHEATRTLLDAVPRRAARNAAPPVGEPVLRADRLVKDYRLPNRRTLRAVDDVSFTIGRGETLALVGESGSGKSSVARMVMGLTRPSSGEVRLADGSAPGPGRATARRLQLVYQNPYASLNPRMRVSAIIAEPLRASGVADREERRARIAELADQVALPARILERRPGELSGGQRQRVAIARALALEPELLVCDEPVSALDTASQAQILRLLARLRDELGLSYLFISHDLAVVRELADRIGVMRSGRLVECGPAGRVLDAPEDGYTTRLLEAIPRPVRDVATDLPQEETRRWN
jgi:peptide/nickel transport system ATP-binding protein